MYQKHRIKSIVIISFLLLFSVVSTYLIYNNFAKQREKDIDTGKMEVIFHGQEGNKIDMVKFNPVTDSVGLSSTEYNFTVKNNTDNSVTYKIILEDNQEKIAKHDCSSKTIPLELLKLSFRKDHETAKALILSEYENNVLIEDTLEANSEEDYSIRLWAVNSNFLVDRDSHFHAIIKVVEEGE